ncbi:MAG: ParB N-terminal domain-containing protein [Methyloprofundus sp.]|nr:ParB N-terminal domain-containing protein [Methyloprofundus sp.]
MTKKKQFTGLNEGQVRISGGQDLAPQDPIGRTPMVVSVFDVMPYQHNPRKHTNESYQDIKDSIYKKGLEQPFLITRRPGDPKYTVKAGGNTRLQILQELYTETKEDRFLKTQLIFDPWVSETDTLISHLTENDLRGNLMLIDRAKAVTEAKALIEADVQMELSVRSLSEALAERGYSINHVHIALLLYANRIAPYLREALDAGAGKPVISKIRKIENGFKKVCEKLALGISDEQMAQWFFDCLAAIDAEQVNIDHLKSELKDRLHHEADVNFSVLDIYFYEAIEGGQEVDSIDSATESIDEPRPSKNSNVTPIMKPAESSSGFGDDDFNEVEDDGVLEVDLEPVDDSAKQTTVSATKNQKDDVHSEPLSSQSEDGLSQPHKALDDNEPKFTIGELRAQAFELAESILAQSDLDDLVAPVSDGYGWVLIGTPNLDIEPDSERFHQAWSLWFTVFLLSGMTDRPSRHLILSHIDPEDDLCKLLNEEFDELSENGQWVSMAAINTDFWSGQAGSPAHTSALNVIAIHSKIRRSLLAAGKSIWIGIGG